MHQAGTSFLKRKNGEEDSDGVSNRSGSASPAGFLPGYPAIDGLEVRLGRIPFAFKTFSLGGKR
jgi:hypothetical protein